MTTEHQRIQSKKRLASAHATQRRIQLLEERLAYVESVLLRLTADRIPGLNNSSKQPVDSEPD